MRESRTKTARQLVGLENTPLHRLHFKDTIPKIRNKYSQKKNYVASVLISTFMCDVSVSDLYIPTISLPNLMQKNMWTDPGNIKIAHRHKTVEIGTEAAQFLFGEHINGTFVAVYHSQGLGSPMLL